MATEKQIIANRKNAAKSTGPKTGFGKRVSSRNSTRHGFYAANVLLPEEDRAEFLSLARRLVLAYNPNGTLQEEQVKTIVETRWQLRRATQVDCELFQIFSFYEGEERGVGTAFAVDAVQGNAFTKVIRYQAFLLRKLNSAEKELARLKESHADIAASPQPEALPLVSRPDNSRAEKRNNDAYEQQS